MGFQHWPREKLRAACLEWRKDGPAPKPASIREMAEIERAWLGAMVEAEGSVGFYNTNGRHGHWRVTIANKDPEVISAALRLTRIGSVCPRPSGVLYWVVDRRNDVRLLAEQLAPYCMKVRRILV